MTESGIRNQESFIRGNLQYMQFTKEYIQWRIIWSYIHLCGLEISIKASRRYHGNHQEKSMSNDEAPCKQSISCIYKNYQSLVISNLHYDDVRMGAIASQITSLAIVYSAFYSGVDQRKNQSSASLAFVWGIHLDRWIPCTKGQLRGKCFHLMTSSWT